ncbi:ABC transporter permease [Paenibacillus wynnii]|uniref:ABC transporter permease n=1 Tax=Paenibacillus wynnii TaxID=268407 RepID=UPI00279307C0|nr:ABC-2 family transporter protein [Paenibacillus wynnii]MDQ0193762.1 ABC-2 type transport system permease protein [Paenibacillus wynnii]
MYIKLLQLQLKTLLEYRFAFFSQVLGIFIGYISTVIVYWLMFLRFDELNGWTFKETMYVYAFAALTINIAAIFFNHFKTMDQEIINGTFDKYLIRPHNVFFSYLISKFDVAEFANLFLSIAVLIYVIDVNHIHFTAVKIVFLFLGIIGAVLVNAGSLVLIGAVSFWTLKSESLYDTILWPAQFLSYLPMGIFPKIIQVLFTFVLPFAFISYYPSTITLDKVNILSAPGLAYSSIGIGIIFFLISLSVWNSGLKKYNGTGS